MVIFLKKIKRCARRWKVLWILVSGMLQICSICGRLVTSPGPSFHSWNLPEGPVTLHGGTPCTHEGGAALYFTGSPHGSMFSSPAPPSSPNWQHLSPLQCAFPNLKEPCPLHFPMAQGRGQRVHSEAILLYRKKSPPQPGLYEKE